MDRDGRHRAKDRFRDARPLLSRLQIMKTEQPKMTVEHNSKPNASLMQGSISFRPLGRSDFSMLQEWLAAPHVNAWWRERLDLAGVEATYAPRVDGVEPTHVFVMEHSGRPVGWIQWYFWSDYPQHAAQVRADLASAGIDLAIGERTMTGLGLGPVAICNFLTQIVFADQRVTAVITDPEKGNLRSLRAFMKAGFKLTDTVQLAGENFERRVVRMDRPQV
jgi:aminoglycoside 6'-N-acetyltransferase